MDMNAWEEYYSNPENIAKIANECRYREISIFRNVEGRKVVIRPAKIYLARHFQYWLDRLNLTETLFDIYCSNASIKMPQLPNDLRQQKYAKQLMAILFDPPLHDEILQWVNQIDINETIKRQWKMFFENNKAPFISGADIFVDVDVLSEEDEPICIDWAKQIREQLKKQGYGKKMPIEIWATGSGGVHEILKGQFSPEFVKDLVMDTCLELDIPMSIPVKIVDGVKYVAKNKKWVKMKPGEKTPIISKPNVDTSIYQIRRIRRVPFSLHSKTGKPMVRIL